MTESEHRLPRDVVPSRYRVLIDTDPAFERFEGSVSIDASVEAPTGVVVLNAKDLELSSVSVSRGGTELESVHRLDEDTERLVIELSEPLSSGPIVIDASFSGRLDPQLEGFYPSTYTDDDGAFTIGVTQFEAAFARKVFPCWDEPSFKAVFEICLIVGADDLAVSNSATVTEVDLGDGRRRVDFAPTMVMSTYLVAWVIGRLEATDPVMAGTTPIRVIARPGQGHLTDFALECASHALAWFEDYYGIAYPGDKIDLVAIPDFAFGAMENLGCVTFRESLLLIDPTEASRRELERAATVIEHELAHMWFGDLVTMSWWNGIWLNEAFATFMEIAAADDFRPEWDMWTSFGSLKTAAFDTDALFSTRPIEYPVVTPEDAEGMFDVLTYEKGASILRMFEQWMGPDRFRAGVSEYLRDHAYANTETGDLWEALSGATEGDLTAAMETWIFTGGHPVVTVEALDDGVRVSQAPFTYLDAPPGAHGATDDRRWSIPILLHAEIGGRRQEARVLLEGDSLDVSLGGRPDSVVANVEASGFYRTRIPRELRADPHRLSPAERFESLDSLAALVTARRADPAELVALTIDIADSVAEAAVWRKIAGIADWFARVAGPDGRDDVAAYARRLVGGRLDGLDAADVAEPHHAEVRSVLAHLAGCVGDDPTVIGMARAILAVPDPAGLDPELVAVAPDIVATHGGRDDFDRLLAMFRDADTPQVELRALGALGRVRDAELIGEFCRLCLDEVRTQNAPYTLAATMANPVGGPLTWRFVAENWTAINDRFPSGSIIRLVAGTRALADVEVIGEVLAFFEDHDVAQARQNLAQHLELLHVNLANIDAYRDRIGAALRA